MANISEYIKIALKLFTVFITLMATIISSLIGGGGGGGETTTTPTTPVTPPTSQNDTFVITAYGYGHGCGMSQRGAIVKSDNGDSYVKILTHYYTGTYVVSDSATPSKITYVGKDGSKTEYGIVEFLCKTTKQEIGDGNYEAAIKAQACAIYTFAKYYSKKVNGATVFEVKETQIAMDKNYNYLNTKLYNCVLSYLGMENASSQPVAKFISKDREKAILSVFCDCVAGKTTDAQSVWGGTGYSYLVPVSSPEEVKGVSVSISSKDMQDYIYDYDVNINLDADPSKWLSIVSHDSALSSQIGYVKEMNVGNKKISGYDFRDDVMKFAIRSHCITIDYKAAA